MVGSFDWPALPDQSNARCQHSDWVRYSTEGRMPDEKLITRIASFFWSSTNRFIHAAIFLPKDSDAQATSRKSIKPTAICAEKPGIRCSFFARSYWGAIS